MANSYVEYTTAGSGTNGLGQTTFTAPTQFLSINDIRVKGLNGSTWTELTISSRGTTTITLSSTPSSVYSKIRVFRSSTTEALIDFQNGSRLAESDLDTAYRQSLFVAQEVAEDADPEGGSGIGNIVSSQLANVSITNSNLAGGIADSKLASGVGTSANNLVKLDSNAKLPAVDGSQLTGMGSTSPAFQARGYGSLRASGAATVNGITLNTNNQIVLFDDVPINRGSHFDNATGIFTAPVAGLYYVSYHLGKKADNGKYVQVGLFLTSSDDTALGYITQWSGQDSSYGMHDTTGASVLVNAAANQQFALTLTQTNTNWTTPDTTKEYFSFGAYLVG